MKYLLLAFAMMFLTNAKSQDSLLIELINKEKFTFKPHDKSFQGRGWDKIDSAVKASNNVLIGEDHFFNEVPFFVSAITDNNNFQNFVIEVDPYSAALISNKIEKLSPADFDKYMLEFGNTFSFYALANELKLLKKMINRKTTIMGTDQVLLVADRLLCNNLKQKSKNKEAIELYELIEKESVKHFNDYLKDQAKPFYMLTPAFDSNIDKLLGLPLSKYEQEQLEAMKLSRKIYLEQSHSLRIQLMKNNLYNLYYNKFKNQKNLFKFGAGHMGKGEALLGGYDIGNIVYNIADSHFERSVHIAVFGKNGTQGSPFKGLPGQTLDPINGDLKSLKLFFDQVKTADWYCFDLTDIQRAIRRGKLTVSDIMLRRVIEGFDYLIIIPEVTASQF